MRIRRTTLAIAAAGALTLTACTSGDAETGISGDDVEAASGDSPETVIAKPDLGEVTTQDTQITYSIGEQEWDSWNDLTASTYTTYNSVINERTRGNFVYFGTDGTILPNEEWGSYEKTSDDPLTVEYTISDEAVWSDGVPVTANDYLLQWASSNPTTLFGEEEGAGLFDPVSTSFGEQVTAGLDTEVDSKTFTLVFDNQYPDWEIMLEGPVPAHVVAEQAGMEPAALAQQIIDKDPEGLEEAAEFYNSGWTATGGELPDPATTPSSGPYTLVGATWDSPESLTLVPNENYWGTNPGVANLTFRFTAPEAMVQALQNGDINIVEPQADVDTVRAIEGLGDAFTLLTGPTLTWEHLDYNFAEGRPFSEAEGGLAAREAFAMCLPRQQIVDNLITPVDPEAEKMDLREVFPFQENYDEVKEAAYDTTYDTVDIEGAKAKLEESGLSTPVDVEIGYSTPNQRRTNVVAEIKSSCDEAGFNIVDNGSATFFDGGGELITGDFDVAMFAWSGSGQIVSGQSIYSTDEGQNYGKYSSEAMDTVWSEITDSIDPEVWLEKQKEIEKIAWDDLVTVPLYAHPGIVGYDASIENVFFNSTQTQAAWNAEQWMRAE